MAELVDAKGDFDKNNGGEPKICHAGSNPAPFTKIILSYEKETLR